MLPNADLWTPSSTTQLNSKMVITVNGSDSEDEVACLGRKGAVVIDHGLYTTSLPQDSSPITGMTGNDSKEVGLLRMDSNSSRASSSSIDDHDYDVKTPCSVFTSTQGTSAYLYQRW